jgi:hypothetical protein
MVMPVRLRNPEQNIFLAWRPIIDSAAAPGVYAVCPWRFRGRADYSGAYYENDKPRPLADFADGAGRHGDIANQPCPKIGRSTPI